MSVHLEFKRQDCRGLSAPAVSKMLGPELAAWLRGRLNDTGIETADTAIYDWGFEIQLRAGGTSYILGLPGQVDRGRLHLFVEKRLSIVERVMGKMTPASDPMAHFIKEIIVLEPDFRLVSVGRRH